MPTLAITVPETGSASCCTCTAPRRMPTAGTLNCCLAGDRWQLTLVITAVLPLLVMSSVIQSKFMVGFSSKV